MSIKYEFNAPVQLKFWDETTYAAGIGYKDKIICGCCGQVFDVRDIVANAPADKEAFLLYETWIDISDAIIGD